MISRSELHARYTEVRQETLVLCEPLATEDYVVQTMRDVSPAKWHLAHTTWFFETFLLRARPDYRPFHPQYAVLFNSYYNGVGEQFPRAQRGLLSRPTVEETVSYRRRVDEAMHELIDNADEDAWSDVAMRVELGLHHEQQHQELFLADIKHVFAQNPLRPAYTQRTTTATLCAPAHDRFVSVEGGVIRQGHAADAFAYDNECPAHTTYVAPFCIAADLVTNEEFLSFMNDGGYERPELWLADGWECAQERGWNAPLYWEQKAKGDWWSMTMAGMQPVALQEPVCHVSHYEADAYARWRGKRLPTETEWERAATTVSSALPGTLRECRFFHPIGARPHQDYTLAHLRGEVWEWTASAYLPYPGFQPLDGNFGEYNGKFMSNQMVLRGGSCATASTHLRLTYRNFFQPEKRWQFSGFRLAHDRI